MTVFDNHTTLSSILPDSWVGKPVEVKNGSTVVFAGVVQDQKYRRLPGKNRLAFDFTCADYSWYADRHILTWVFEPDTLANILTSIISFSGNDTGTLVGDGINATPVVINSAGSPTAGPTLPRLIYRFSTISQVFDDLAKRTGYSWIIDFDKVVKFRQAGVAAPFSLTDSSDNYDDMVVDASIKDYRNLQVIVLDIGLVPPVTEIFSGSPDYFTAVELGATPVITRRTSVNSSAALTFSGLPSNTQTVTIDGHVYTFKTALAGADDVLIGATSAECARNLAYAINNAEAFAGYYFGSGTVGHTTCKALNPLASVVTVWFIEPGVIGDGTAVLETLSNAAWSASTLTGGVDGEESEQSVGIFGVDPAGTHDWYWLEGTTKIALDPAVDPPGAGQFIQVDYKPIFSNQVTVKDATEIAAYASIDGTAGIIASAVDDNSSTVADSFNRGSGLLRVYGKKPRTIDYLTNDQIEPLSVGLRAGDYQSVIITDYGLSQLFLVESVESEDVEGIYMQHRVKAVGFSTGVGQPQGSWVDFLGELFTGGGVTSGSSAGSGGGGGGTGGGGGISLPVPDSTVIVTGSVDTSKAMRFDVSGLDTGRTAVLAVQNFDAYTLAGIDITNVFSADQAFRDIQTRHIIPATALTYDIGQTSNRFRAGYFQDIHLSGALISSLGAAGVEYAPLVSSFVATIAYQAAESGDYGYQINCTWVNPSGPTSDKHAGTTLVYRPPGGDGSTDIILAGVDSSKNTFSSPFFPVPSEVELGFVYALSFNQLEEHNSYLFGTTPQDDVTIQPQIGTLGHEYAPDVTGLDVTVTYFADAAGGYNARLIISFTEPDDPTFMDVDWIIRVPDGSYSEVGGSRSGRVFITPAPDSVESWVHLAVARNTNGDRNTYLSDPDDPVSAPLSSTPKVTRSVGDASGKLNAGKINALTLAAHLRINAGLLGVAPGTIGNTEITDTSVTTQKLTTSEISLGGGGGKPIRFRVYSNTGTPIGWIGDDTVNSGFVGAWFQRMYVGGSGPSGAPFQVDAIGRLTISLVSGTVGSEAFNLTINNVNTKIANITAGGGLPGSIQYIGLKVQDTTSGRFAAVTPNNVGVTNSPIGGPPCATLYLTANNSGAAFLEGFDLQQRIDLNTDPGNPFMLSIQGLVSGQLRKTFMGPDYVYAINNAGKTVWALGIVGNGGAARLTNGTGSGGFDGIGSLIYCQGQDGVLKAQSLQSPGYAYWNGASAEFGAFGTFGGLTNGFVSNDGPFVTNLFIQVIKDGSGFVRDVFFGWNNNTLINVVHATSVNNKTHKAGLITS